MDHPIETNNFAFDTSAIKHMKIKRTIKYENELDKNFAKKIAKLAYGEAMFNCIQCGTCSATCPVSHYMDYTPRKIIAMVREGFKNEVLSSSTVWLCSSCYSCTVECPKSIKITDVMYTLKREAIAGGYYPKRFPMPVLAESFYNLVKRNGRNSEGPLLLKLFMNTNPFKIFGNAVLGLKLFLTGRISMKSEKIKDRDNFSKLLSGSIMEHVKEVSVK